MLSGAVAVTAVGGTWGALMACIFMTDLCFYVAALVWNISLMILCGCYVFRLVQIYCCTTTWRLPNDDADYSSGAQHGADDAAADQNETDALHQPQASVGHEGRPVTRFVVSLAVALVTVIICIAFMTMVSSSDDYSVSEVAISSTKGLAVCIGMGILSSIAFLGFLLEVWASGLLSCGCCPRVISVPVYLLPKDITVVLFVVWGAVGGVIGVVCRALVVKHGLLWCTNHFAVPVSVGFGAGGVAGVGLWVYGMFVFLPQFKATCSPLQRDAYFGAEEAIQHRENLDGIGDDAL